MSLSQVRPYFKARATGLGWKEWKEPFNFQNIPSTLIDGAFNIEIGSASGLKQNQIDLEMSVPVTVRHFRKGFRDPQAALDLSAASAESYITQALKASNRLTGAGIKNVQLNSVNWQALSATNDNSVVTEMTFTALVILGLT